MKILFLTYHGFEAASGISKKMLAQIKGLRQNGHEVHVCSYDVRPDGNRCRFVDDEVIHNYGKGRWASILQRMDYSCVNDYCRKEGIELVYARSFMNASPANIRLFKRLHADGIKTLMEVPTYPYDKEFESLPFKYRFEHIFDKMFRCKLSSYMDAIVTFSDAKNIFGQRTINISNGIDFDVLPLQPAVDSTKELHVIAVAEVHPWHGFDRFIEGLGKYYNSSVPPRKKVYFHVVGGVDDFIMYGSKHSPGFIPYIKKYHIEEYVVFHGKLFGEDLDNVFAKCSFAVGSLARHRSGITHIKTLKNREYACRGIPFIYSECDSDFDHQPYIMKAPADETPIDINAVLGFLAQHEFIPAEIRKTIEYLSWKSQMKCVLDRLMEM